MARTIPLTWDTYKGTLTFDRDDGDHLKRSEVVTLRITMLSNEVADTSVAGATATLKPVNRYGSSDKLADWTLTQIGATNVLTGSQTLDSQTITDLLGTVTEKWNCILDIATPGAVFTKTIAMVLENNSTRSTDGTPTPTAASITASGYTIAGPPKLLGRTTSGTGAIELITVAGTGFTFAGGTLTLTGGDTTLTYNSTATSGFTAGDFILSKAGNVLDKLTPGAGIAAFLATPSGANLASALTTALPASKGGTGLTALGTGVATALGNALDGAGGIASVSYADSLVVGLLDDRGNFDASGNVFPSSGGSGTAGAILKGDLWLISVAGTLGGSAVAVGDQIRALSNTPGQTAGNWAISEANIGYVPLSQTLANGSIFVGNASNIATAYALGTGVKDALAIAVNTLGGVLTTIPTGKTLWVDGTNGNDANAGTFRYSFAGLAAAVAAATAGDLIHVRPGTYAVTDSILKNGVNWHFDAGATVTMTQNASAIGILDDKGAAITCNVTGQGTFSLSSTADGGGAIAGNVYTVRVRHASSVVNVNALDITMTGTGSTATAEFSWGAVSGESGVLTVNARNETVTGDGGLPITVNWLNGTFRNRASSIGGKYCVWVQCNDAPTGDFFVEAEDIAGEFPIFAGGANATAAAWIHAKTVRCNTADARSIWTDDGAIAINVNKIYVQSEKIFGRIYSGGGLLYVDAQKLTATESSEGFFITSASAGNAFIRIAHLDDANYGSGFHPIICTPADNGSATLRLYGANYVSRSGVTGIQQSNSSGAPTLLLSGCNLDFSAAATNGIIASKGTVNVEGCRITSNASYKDIAQSSTATVNVSGGWGTGSNGNFTTSGTVNQKWQAGTFPGDITGNAATVTTNANLTGPVTSTGNATAIANGAISNAMLANSAVANLSGTNTGDQTLPTGANPSASVGTSAVNGSSANFMRADAAPALDQSISPTMTGAWIFSKAGAASVSAVKLTGVPFGGTGTTSFPLLYLNDAAATASTTLATVGTYLGVNGHGTADLANLMLDGVSRAKVSSGGNLTILGDLLTSAGDFSSSVGTGSVRFLRVWTDGVGFRDKVMRYWAPAGVTVGVGTDGFPFYVNGSLYISDGGGNVNARLACPTVDGLLVLSNNAATAFTRLVFGVNTSSGAALAISGTTITACLGDGTAGGTFEANALKIGTGATVSKILLANNQTCNVSSLAAGVYVGVDITVTGAASGDFASVSFRDTPTSGIVYNGHKVGTDKVTVYFYNTDLLSSESSSQNVDIIVFKAT